ncbi:MAG: YkgJ family cysteine cluster protein [Acidobacteria bacterium]|nr:YkgJ family cysteine cluster protein [Acidobacteriota bacterium]
MHGSVRVRSIRVLSVHAPYRCQHSGACCTSGWPIPVERDRVPALQAALADGRLTSRSPDGDPFIFPAAAPAGSPAIVRWHDEGCTFHDGGRARCRVHRALGHAALPLACRQFPRVSVLDPAGAAITLSHYCPTAAALLDADQASTTIVRNAPAFAPDGEYVGLDAREALPPLLRRDMLMDWPAWWAWERRATDHLGRREIPVDRALADVEHLVERVRAWSPDHGPLEGAVIRAFDDLRGTAPARRARPGPDALIDDVLQAVPRDFRPAHLERTTGVAEHVRRRFLAAHAFANWTAHLGGGLRSWLRSIDAADALLSHGVGVRQADLLLRHLADPHELTARFSEAEDR